MIVTDLLKEAQRLTGGMFSGREVSLTIDITEADWSSVQEKILRDFNESRMTTFLAQDLPEPKEFTQIEIPYIGKLHLNKVP